MILFKTLYRHKRTGNHYAIVGVGRIKENGKWVEAINYRPIPCADDPVGRVIVQELYSRPATEFKEKFESTDLRSDNTAHFEHIREVLDVLPATESVQRLCGSFYNTWSHLLTVKALENSIAQLDVDGVITGLLQRVYEKNYSDAYYRTLRELINPISFPSTVDMRINPVTDLLIATMAERLGWKKFPNYQTTNAIKREYYHWGETQRESDPRILQLLLEICEYSNKYL